MRITQGKTKPVLKQWIMHAWIVVLVLFFGPSLFYVAQMTADDFSRYRADHHPRADARFGFNMGLIKSGERDYSILIVRDYELDGDPAIAQGYGCGRSFRVRDPGFGGREGRKETKCNLYNIRTGQVTESGIEWGEWSARDQPSGPRFGHR